MLKEYLLIKIIWNFKAWDRHYWRLDFSYLNIWGLCLLIGLKLQHHMVSSMAHTKLSVSIPSWIYCGCKKGKVFFWEYKSRISGWIIGSDWIIFQSLNQLPDQIKVKHTLVYAWILSYPLQWWMKWIYKSYMGWVVMTAKTKLI